MNGRFNYMIIEASGVSEPAAIAELFAVCDDDHDHEEAHKEPQLSEVARLDTCVTVVAADQFFSNFETVNKGADNQCWPTLLVEQIEYANVILLNKTDLVSASQLGTICNRIAVLNPKARIIRTHHSVLDVTQVLNTKLYHAEDFKTMVLRMQPEEAPECCKQSIAHGETACCKRARTIISKVSEVLLSPKAAGKTRHATRFGLTSFLYKARRPFHPKRFHVEFVDKYFVIDSQKDEEEEEEEEDNDEEGEEDEEDKEDTKSDSVDADTDQDKAKSDEELALEKQQEAIEKQRLRTSVMGGLLRMKGFVWLPQAHDLKGVISQAGNMIRTDFESRWNVLERKAYENTDEKAKAALRTDWQDPWGDRRQELVFIGQKLKHTEIQGILDNCLLTDDEFAMGVDAWKALMGCVFLDNGDETAYG